ncbi:hypothetical protein, partial [Methanoculleus sp.]|uniref:hypothetical protein n=1 Tax=Methanoculleus sp. TaxID=90427 RepID=UPI0025F88BDD
MDVSAIVPANATGVILHLYNDNGTTDYTIGFRKNGSTDNRTTLFGAANNMWCAIGVDANRIFEIYASNNYHVS